jgi:hypothetical protein
MTSDLEAELEAWMQAVPVSVHALDDLRAVDLPVRARWAWLPQLTRLAAAATAVVAVAVLALSWSTAVRPPAGAVPPDPAAFAGDPRLSRCVAGGPAPLAAFEMAHASDYRLHLPAMGLSPELDRADPAFVVVLAPGGTPVGGGAPGVGGGWHPSDSPSTQTPGPNVHDLCVLVGADASTADRTIYANVDTTGLRALLSPSPSASPTDLASSDPLPNPGGTCSASQIVLGTPTWGYGYGTLGTTAVYGTLPLRNIGGACVMALPAVIGVATATGPFHAVAVRNTGIATAWGSGSGESVPIMLGASWWIGVKPDNGTPLPAPPCNDPIFDVSRVEIPLATGAIAVDLPIVWHEVCSSPASVSIAFVTK